jgi:hypothetical protein
MTLAYDPIPVLQSAGYTEREAAFLYLAALHSGYFLRRQYLRFIERGRGALAAQFLRRAFALGHIQSIACGQARFVYHLRAAAIYDAVGLAASQHRRIKGDASIKSRLMVLDFVLDHLDEPMLDTRESKLRHFSTAAGMEENRLPVVHGTVFGDDFPVLLGEPLRFTFVDEGALSSSTFERFLSRYRAVFDALPGFGLLYVADSAENTERGRAIFVSRYRPPTAPGTSSLTPRGIDHLSEYLLARQRVEGRKAPPTLRDLAVLREGEVIYNTPRHHALLAEFDGSDLAIERIRQRLQQQRGQAAFTPVILRYQYPLHRFKFEGRSKRKLGSSAGSISGHLFES